MPLATIVVIVLRLFAIYWMVSGISTLVGMIPLTVLFSEKMGSDFPWVVEIVEYLGIPTVMLVMATIVWVFAANISSRIVKGHDTTITFSALAKEDLYHFAFVFLGLYIFLSSLYSGTQNAIHFFTSDFALNENDPVRGRYLQPFLGSVVSAGAGLACIFGARKWTRALLKRESSGS